jgi:hypothetical protein
MPSVASGRLALYVGQDAEVNRFDAGFPSAINRGRGSVELAAAPSLAVNAGGAGPKDPLMEAVPGVPPGWTQTRKSAASLALGLARSISHTAVAEPFTG